MKVRNLKIVAVLGLVGTLTGGLVGCANQYHLKGNHTWTAPAPIPRGQSAYAPSSGGGNSTGNTSFVR
jgi:hypothetical protein